MRRLLSRILFLALLPVTLLNNQSVAEATGESVTIVALGDSYTSGNGALDYQSKDCYRSSNAYIHKYASHIRGQGLNAQSYNYACYGATTADVPGQIARASASLSEADVVTVTIGGNDGKFTELVVNCLAETRWLKLCHDDIERLLGELDRITSLVGDTLRAIDGATANDTQIVLIGYPYLIGRDCFADTDIFRSLQSAADSKYYLLVDSLRRSGLTNIHYMPLLSAFAGGEVCGDGPQLIRGTLDTTDFKEWWHPNKEGHAVIGRELYQLGLHDISDKPSSGAPSPGYQLPPPNDGQPVYEGLPFACGSVIPYASTYGTVTLKGGAYSHGRALDMPMPEGTGVFAPESGTVSVHLDGAGYGKYIDLQGDSGIIHRFAHLAHTSVNPAQRVSFGQKLGMVGATGAATGPHLHYEQRNTYGQIEINLGGPPLSCGSSSDGTGFKTTTHALVSGLCSTSLQGRFEDIMTLSYNHFAWGRSDGDDRNTWGTAKQDVFVPESVDSCDFDDDGFDEYIVLDVETSRIMMADPKESPNGHFYWLQIGTTTSARKIVCGDWNGDGLDDVLFHNTNNVIYYGRSNGSEIVEWRVALLNAGSRPSFWDMCDIDGNGTREVISYHPTTNRYLVGYRGNGVSMSRAELLDNVAVTNGFVCGDFLGDKADEIIWWDAKYDGRYLLAQFGNGYSLVRKRELPGPSHQSPHNGEMAAGDINGDGYDDFVVNLRGLSGEHMIYYGVLTSDYSYEWREFQDGMHASHLAVGEFVQ